MNTTTELQGRIGLIEAALGEHVAGTMLALQTIVLSITRQTEIDAEGVIADLDREVAALPSRAAPKGIISAGVADLLRMATQAKA